MDISNAVCQYQEPVEPVNDLGGRPTGWQHYEVLYSMFVWMDLKQIQLLNSRSNVKNRQDRSLIPFKSDFYLIT